jgi:PhnB protein
MISGGTLQPPGFTTVFPYLFVDNAPGFCAFLSDGLGFEEMYRSMDGDRIANAQLRVGDTTIMVSEAGRGFGAMAASFYIYVADARSAMDRALTAGAQSIMEVADMPYGDRQGGVRDAWGNIWWISQRLSDGPY